MTDKEFDLMMQHNPHLRITQEDGGRASVAAQIARAHAAVSVRLEENAQPLEDEMQAAVIAWADAHPHPALRWLAHIPNGGYRPKSTLGSIPGVKAGIPDLVLWWRKGDCPGLCIEMKRRPNKPSDKQLEWLAHLDAQGWRWAICYSAQAAIDVLREYLDIEAES